MVLPVIVVMIRLMTSFIVQNERIDLPRGAYFKSCRQYVLWRGRPVLGLSQNQQRSYLFPVYTPLGFSLTTETPVDHPHHNSVWVGADHVNCFLPFADHQFEKATYNFYLNETFQGRAPGRIVSQSVDYRELSEIHLRIGQSLNWQGPSEWGASDGRTIAVETRTIDIYPGVVMHTIDIRSQIRPTEWDLQIGPTRHAYFGIRLTELLRPSCGATLVDSEGRRGVSEINGKVSDWIHIVGEVAAGHQAGMAVFRYPATARESWYVYDWGTIDVNPLRHRERHIKVGEQLDYAIRIIVHDGGGHASEIAQQHKDFVDGDSR